MEWAGINIVRKIYGKNFDKNVIIMSFAVFEIVIPKISGAPNDNFRENICSEDDLRSRIFGTFVVKFLACLPLLGSSNI